MCAHFTLQELLRSLSKEEVGEHGISLISRGAQLKKKAAEAAEAGKEWTSLALYKSALDCMVGSWWSSWW